MATKKEERNNLESKLDALIDKGFKHDLSVEYIDSGSIIINMILGGGLPLGKLIQIYSESGYGKSTIVLSICKYLCKTGHKVLYIDAEGSINELIESMGFYEENLVYNKKTNPKGNFVVFQTSYFKDAEEIFETLLPNYDEKGLPIKSEFTLAVLDSVPALNPSTYMANTGEITSVESAQPGVHAKIMGNFIRKFDGYKTEFNMSFLFINQIRKDIMSFIPKDVLPGGQQLYYLSDVILKLVSGNKGAEHKLKVATGVGDIQEIIDEREVAIYAVKHKLVKPGVRLPLQIVYGKGISNRAAMPKILSHKYITNDQGKQILALEGSGAWQTLNVNIPDEADDKKFKTVSIKCNGRDQLREEIKKYFQYIYPTITKEDFQLLIENPEEDEDISGGIAFDD